MGLKKSLAVRGISAYLAMAFAGLSIVLTLVLAGIIGLVTIDEVKSSIGHSLEQLALQTSDKLDRGMFERYREVRLMADRADLFGAHRALDTRRRVLDDLQRTYPFYAWLGITDLDGRVLAATRRQLEGEDVSKRPWFGNALRGVYLGDVHEALMLARLQPDSGSDPKRFVDIAFPYRDRDGKIAGVLAAHLSWQWARDVEQSIMRSITAQRHVESFIVGARGDVLLGPPAWLGKQLDIASFRQAQKQGSGYVVERWSDGHRYLVGFSKGKGYSVFPGMGWTVLVRQDIDDAYQPVTRIQHHVLGYGLALALLFALLGGVAARRITRPLEQLAQSAQRIQSGEANSFVPVANGYYEVKALSSSIDGLLSNLMQREEALRELNLTLEKRVDERTGALEQALVAVRASQRRIAAIVEVAQDAYVGMDLDGRITGWNTQAERTFGWAREEALGCFLIDLIVPERFRDGFTAQLAHFRLTGQIDVLGQRLERVVMDRHGNEFPVEITVGLAGSGDEMFFSAFLHDISERRKVEQMKAEFVSTVSHELRTPLTSIRASLALLADGSAGDMPADVHMLIGIASQSCERLVRLINDVLDVQKIEAGSMDYRLTVQPLLPIVEQALSAMQGYARQYGVTLRLDSEPEMEHLVARVDHDRLIQVLTNLLSNAIKFSPRGAQVTMRVAAGTDDVRLSVVDQGVGIPEEFAGRIFQKFAQADATDSRSKGGTGLGLSICKSIVEALGGRITFESVPGRGTRFEVALPRAEKVVG